MPWRPATPLLLSGSMSLLAGCHPSPHGPSSGAPSAPSPVTVTCPPGGTPVAGVCLMDDDALRYCGKAARPEPGGCAVRVCEAGGPIDEGTGECVGLLALKKLAEGRGVVLKGDASVGCAMPEAGVRVEGDAVACLPNATTCGRGARWVAAGDAGGACTPEAVCPLGTLPDTTTPERPCVAVLTRHAGTDEEPRLDVGAWVRLALGNDGAQGTAAVCGPLLRRPWQAKVTPRATGEVAVRVDLVFPDNDVSQARAKAEVEKPFDPHDLENTVVTLDSGYLEPVWQGLRALGGVASAASATVHLRCTLEGGAQLSAVP